MERAIIQENAAQIYHTPEVPLPLLDEANSLYLASKSTFVLKPNQELARTHICCVLAGEKLRFPDIAPADLSRPPIPPAQYQKLLKQFRSSLIPPSTPKRARRRTRADITKYIEPDEINSKYDDDDDFELKKVDLKFEEEDEDGDEGEDEDIEEFLTPRKNPPVSTRYASPSPRKSSTGPRVKQPTISDVEEIANGVGLEKETETTVVHAFSLYEDLVKEKWGLVYGLLVVITDRIEPRPGSENEWRISRVFNTVCPTNVDKPEWQSWCERIIRNQSWMSKYSRKSEKTLELIGSAGGWGLGVEFELTTNYTS